MRLTLYTKLAETYTSASQKIRVLTESWVDNSVYCPNCGQLEIENYPNNKPVADFYCTNCKEDYELKSKNDSMGVKRASAYRMAKNPLPARRKRNLC